MLRGLLTLTCVCMLVLVGCGSDDEDGGTTGTAATSTGTQIDTETEALTETEIETETAVDTETTTAPTSTSTEDQPVGGGDEEPARSQALLTGKGGRITPTVVKVPPFIAIRVELRSSDGKTYTLDFGNGKRVTANQQIASASTQFPGLRPEQKLVGRPVGGAGNRVTILPSAEPGP
jgi:hypothetical protein